MRRSLNFVLLLSLVLAGYTYISKTSTNVFAANPGEVVINELMYHPQSGNEDDEFLELHNTTGSSIDLSNWCFTDGIELCFDPGTSINANGYLIISGNYGQTQATYSMNPAAIYTGALSNGGERIVLEDASSSVIDEIEYDDSDPWPTTPDGAGPSLELKDPSFDNEQASSWSASYSTPTPGAMNSWVAIQLPVILSTSEPGQVGPSEQVVITTEVEGQDQLDLKYIIGFEAEQTISMSDNGSSGDGEAGDGIFGATIPGQDAGDLVRFKIVASNANGEVSYPSVSDTRNYLGYVVEDSELESTAPILQWFISDEDYADLINTPEDIDAPFYDCVIAYGDQVFGGAQVALKGEYTRSVEFPKKAFKIELPKGHKMSLEGISEEPLDQFHLNSGIADNRYILGALSWRVADQAGFNTPPRSTVQLQKNGEFEGAYLLIQKYDGDWRENNSYYTGTRYEDGPLYEDYWEKKTFLEEDSSDMEGHRDALLNPNQEERMQYFYDNQDIPNAINFMAVQALIRGHDWSVRTNTYSYFDREGNERWSQLPWDFDLTFNQLPPNGGQPYNNYINPYEVDTGANVIDSEDRFFATAIWDDPVLREMYKRRLRTLVDEVYTSGDILQWVEEEHQKGETPFFLDYQKWYQYEEDGEIANLLAILDQVFPGIQNDAALMELMTPFLVPPSTPLDELDQDFFTSLHPFLPYNRKVLLKYGLKDMGIKFLQDYTEEGLISSEPQPTQPNIRINEIMYQPQDSEQNEYIELYNPHSTPVDISGWELDGVGLVFPGGSVLPAEGYGMVVKKDPSFRQTYGGGKYIVAQYPGEIDNSTISLSLNRADNTVATSVNLSSSSLPATTRGAGSSISLLGLGGEANVDCWADSPSGGTISAANTTHASWPDSRTNACLASLEPQNGVDSNGSGQDLESNIARFGSLGPSILSNTEGSEETGGESSDDRISDNRGGFLDKVPILSEVPKELSSFILVLILVTSLSLSTVGILYLRDKLGR